MLFSLFQFPFLILLINATGVTDTSYDFGSNKDGNNWVVINDGVMGGLSRGVATLDENSMVFQGTISFANNGGFASLRSNRIRLSVSEVEYVEIKYRLKGLSFSLMLEQSYRYWLPYYSYPLETTEDEWVTKRIPIGEFYETRLGDYTGRYLNKNRANDVIRVGFISRDKKAESFELEIDYIKIS